MEVMKRLRQQQIRDLIGSRAIRTQHELAAALRDRGFRATQATISRDVAELGLVKVNKGRVRGSALPPRAASEVRAGERLRQLLHALPIEIKQAGLLLVARAVPGSAHA